MEPGQVCRLVVAEPPSGTLLTSSTADVDSEISVTVVIVAVRPHAEDTRRLLYYVHCTHIDLSSDFARQRKRAAASSWHGVGLGTIGSGTVHRSNELRVSQTAFLSSDGYHYRYDGWYDAAALRCVEEPVRSAASALPPPSSALSPVKVEENTSEGTCTVSSSTDAAASTAVVEVTTQRRSVPEEWVTAMERDTAVCEIVYLCYAFRPWFPVAYTALQYLSLPEADICHSIYLCHRCLSPFFTREQFYVHLDGGYCGLRSPPGRLLYHDSETGLKAFLIDGAKDLHYGRCLSLLGKHFIESKLLSNDVDLYEYVVVTTPRASLPHDAACGVSADAFTTAATHFDAAAWDGNVVMGYFSRLKHHPDHTLSCIATVPIFQRRRVATFLLDLAYWMTGQRQRLCGGPRCCGIAGGAISRPFSPHGQSLLIGYWRRALLRALDAIAPRRRASRTAQSELSFSLPELQAMMDIPIHLQDLEMMLLQSEFTFYASNAASASSGGREGKEGRSSCGSGSGAGGEGSAAAQTSRRPRRDVNVNGASSSPSPSAPCLSSSSSPAGAAASVPSALSGQRYTATMVLEEACLDAAEGRSSKATTSGAAMPHAHAVFQKKWLMRDGRGVYAYDLPQLHY